MAAHEADLANQSTQLRLLDALDRAWRTFYGAVGVDLVLAIAVGLQQLMQTNDPFTAAFWWLLLVLIVKSILSAVVSFMLRFKKAPAVDTAAEHPEMLQKN